MGEYFKKPKTYQAAQFVGPNPSQELIDIIGEDYRLSGSKRWLEVYIDSEQVSIWINEWVVKSNMTGKIKVYSPEDFERRFCILVPNTQD